MKLQGSFRFALLQLALVCLFFQSRPDAIGQYANTNGLFAEFNTSMGSFTCRLDQVTAPKAVANFIGLATGERAWLDVPTGRIRNDPFFNGTTFHRVITNFMNQAGSRNGLGTDGPGYQFTDEFNTNVLHTGFGVLSMANSGPDSNGSQFFVTVAPQPHLNGVHTVFGRLYGGSNVVYAINRVATTNDRPITPVHLNSVIIRRIGTTAQNFNIHAQGLPLVTNLNLSIARSGAGVSLSFSNRLDAGNRLYASTNLQNWSSAGSFGFETSLPMISSAMASASAPAEFFRAVQVQYPPSLRVPKNVLNRVLVIKETGGPTFTITLNGAGGGSYTNSAGSSGGIGYAWTQDPYRGRFRPMAFQQDFPREYHLDWDTPTNGTFKGKVYIIYQSFPAGSVSGTFTISN